jgi:rare lipoprotein A
LLAAFLLGLAGCSSAPPPPPPVTEALPPPTGSYKVGQPYQIAGVWYYPQVDYSYDTTGVASWYGPGFHKERTANGEIYNENELTAAHQTLPMPSLVRVTNLDNGRSIVVRINDRGPFKAGRILDMSRRSAQLLGFEQQGTAKVRVQILAEESRAIAAASQAATVQLAGSPDNTPKPSASPRPTVQVEGQPLPPPGGAPERTILAPTTVAGATDAYGRFLPAPDVHQSAVGGTKRLYVQAGAFTIYDKANKLKAKLSSIGPTTLTSTTVNKTQFFRVRVGPIENVDRADTVLAEVIAAGENGARIVVDN